MMEKMDVKEAEISPRELARTITIGWFGALLEWTDFYTYAILAPSLQRHSSPPKTR